MKQFTLIFFSLMFCIQLSAQDCTITNLILSSQAQVDSFAIIYPGCTEFDGNITISDTDTTPITNLNALSQIKTLKGDLQITNNDELTNLEGLNNLKVAYGLHIISNAALINLAGLDSLYYVSGELVVSNNASLLSLSGLNNLTQIDSDGSIEIIDNASLLSLSGLNNLTWLDDDCGIEIINNASLVSLSGLNSLTRLDEDGYIKIINNASLVSLSGLDSLVSVGEDGYIRIAHNPSLISLAGLGSLEEIDEGSLYIHNNSALVSLTGLEKLDDVQKIYIDGNSSLTTLEGLADFGAIDFDIVNNASLVSLSGLNFNGVDDDGNIIANNPNLVVCNTETICNYLIKATMYSPVENLSLQIYDNAPGCASTQEVLDACTMTDVEDTKPSHAFSIFPIPANDNIQLQFDDAQKAIQVHILNLIGEIVHTQTIDVVANTPLSFDISDYASGVYFMRIYEGQETVTKRFVKQ